MAEHKKLSMLVKLDDGQTYTLGGDGADNAVTLDTEQTITGLKTFDKLPQSSVKPKADADLITKGYADGHYLPVDTKPHKYDILVKMKHDGTSWVGFSDFSVRLRDGTRLDVKHIENQSATTATQPVKAVFKTVKELTARIEAPTQQPATFFDSYNLEAGEFTGTVSFYKVVGNFGPASYDIKPWYVYVGSGNANNYDGIYAVSIDNLDKPLLGVNFKFGDAHTGSSYTCLQCGVVFTVDGSALEVAYDGDMSNAFETTIEYPINAQSMIGVVKVDNAQEITGAKTFTQNIKVTAKPKEATDVATVGYISGLLNAKAPYEVTLDFKVESKTDGGWVVYSNMEINLDNGKKLKCIHIDNTQPTSANAPVKAVFKAIPATEAINAAPAEQAPTFFDTYQLQDEEYLGTLTYGHILNSQLQDYSSYKGPFHTNQYGTTCTIKEATQLRISISELPAAVSKVSLKFDGSYLPKTFKASMSGVGIDVTSNVLTNPSGNTPLELLFDIVKLTGLVTLDTAQTITGAKTFEVLPKSKSKPVTAFDLVNKKYVDEKVGAGGGTGAAPANMVTTDTAQNITEVKTFDKLPKSSVEPTDDTELVNKKYVDDASKKVVTLADAQTITGVKTFNALPQSSVEPATDTDLVNKKYVDAKVGGGGAAGGNVMTLDTEQTVTAVKQFDKFPRLSDNYAYMLPTDPKEFVNKAYVDTATQNNNGYEVTFHGAVTDAGKNISFYNVVMTLENGDTLVPRYLANDNKPGQVAEAYVLWSYGDTGKTYGYSNDLTEWNIRTYTKNYREVLGKIKLGSATVNNRYNFSPAEMTFTSQNTDEQRLVTFIFEASMPPITKIAFRSSSGDNLGKSFRITTKVTGSNDETSTPNQTSPNASWNYNLDIKPAFVPEPAYVNRFQEQDVIGKIHFKEIPVLDKPVDKFGLVKGNTAVAMADLFNSIAVPVPQKQVINIDSRPTKTNIGAKPPYRYQWDYSLKLGDMKLTRKNPSTLANEELFLKFCGPSADGYKGVLTTKKPENYLNPVVEKTDSEMNQYKLEAGECWCKLGYGTRLSGLFTTDEYANQEKQGSDKLKDLFLAKSLWYSRSETEYSWDENGGPKAAVRLYIYDSALVSWETQIETYSYGDTLEVYGDKDFKSYRLYELNNGPNYPKDVPDVNLQTTNVLGIISALEARIKALEDAAPKP